MSKNHQRSKQIPSRIEMPVEPDDAAEKLETIPSSYQDILNYYAPYSQMQLSRLRFETLKRIERITGVPMICYVTKTHDINGPLRTYIEDSDLNGFIDLVNSVTGESIDIFIVSNGGVPEAAERIVQLIREHFNNVRFVVPGNAYSAATMICFSGDEIIMSEGATLGPIDPQINGIPARAILRGFEEVQNKLEKEGPQGLPAYLPLIQKYDLHIFEVCKSYQKLSTDLACAWLSHYMFKCSMPDQKVDELVDYFSNYDIHKSHSRTIDRNTAINLGLKVSKCEKVDGLAPLIRSLYNQFEFNFDKTPFYKMFENAHGISWGKQGQMQPVEFIPPR